MHPIIIIDSRHPDLGSELLFEARLAQRARARAAAAKHEARQLEEKRKDPTYQRAEAKRAKRRARNLREGR